MGQLSEQYLASVLRGPELSVKQQTGLDEQVANYGRGRTAQSSLDALVPDEARANAMRDYSTPVSAAAGNVVSPLAILGQIMQNSSGRQQVRDIKGKREGFTEQLNQAATGEKRAGLKLAMEAQEAARQKAVYDARVLQEKEDYTRQINDRTYNYNKEQADRTFESNQNALAAGAETWIAPGKPNLNVVRTKNGYVDAATGQPVALTNDYRKAPTRTTDTTGQTVFYEFMGKAETKLATERQISARTGNRLLKTAKALDPADVKALASSGQMMKMLAMETLPGSLTNYLKQNFSDLKPETLGWLEDIASLDAVQRNDLFGSALSKGETALSKAFLATGGGLDVSAITRRMGGRMDALKDGLIIYDTQTKGSKGTQFTDWWSDNVDYNQESNAAPVAPVATVMPLPAGDGGTGMTLEEKRREADVIRARLERARLGK